MYSQKTSPNGTLLAEDRRSAGLAVCYRTFLSATNRALYLSLLCTNLILSPIIYQVLLIFSVFLFTQLSPWLLIYQAIISHCTFHFLFCLAKRMGCYPCQSKSAWILLSDLLFSTISFTSLLQLELSFTFKKTYQ